MMKRVLSFLMILMLATVPALADALTLDGSVVATQTNAVLSPAAATLGSVLVQAGDRVEAGQEIGKLYTQSVYAEQSGVVHLFGAEGEAVETLSSRYGAVAYIEPDCQYTLSASTSYAYNTIETKIVHPGETVYLRCVSGCDHTGVGCVTGVSGTSFTVEITEGIFRSNESVSVFRDPGYDSTTRIGKGNAAHASPVAYTGTGTVTAVHVNDGAHVEAGALLYETLEIGAFSHRIVSPCGGVVADVSVSAGTAMEQGTLIASIYPDDAMRVAVEAEEMDLRSIQVGMEAFLSFTSGVTAAGVVERISGVQKAVEATEDSEDEDPTFLVYITLNNTDGIAYGMTAKVTLAE